MNLDTDFTTALPEHLDSEQLEAAFGLFNQLSQQLAQSYGELEKQAAQLSGELAEARHERLKQLAEKEQLAKHLEVLLNTLPAGILVLDSKGIVRQFNLKAQDMLGDNLSGQHWEALTQQHFIREGDGLRLHDGRWISLCARALRQDVAQISVEKTTGEKIVLMTDVTEIHQLEASLNHQQRLTSLGEMVASLAHQIRTPLSSALLYLANINHPNASVEDRRRFTDKATDSLHHLERMVNDMLIFARGGVTENESFTIGEIITQLQQLLAPQFSEANAYLRITNNAEELFLQGNRDALLSAFQNIASNALEACQLITDRASIFEIKVKRSANKMVEFIFKDNGCGISDKIKSRILEPFFTTRSSGTGLGLAVLNETVLNHHGTVSIHSWPGKGSCFSIKFPVATQHTILNSELLKHEHSETDSSIDVNNTGVNIKIDSSYNDLTAACRVLNVKHKKACNKIQRNNQHQHCLNRCYPSKEVSL